MCQRQNRYIGVVQEAGKEVSNLSPSSGVALHRDNFLTLLTSLHLYNLLILQREVKHHCSIQYEIILSAPTRKH